MVDEIIKALFSYLTPLTIIAALFIPSVYIAAALGVVVGMVGAFALNGGQPDQQVVAAWLIAQAGAAVATTLIYRKSR